jgi:predicted lipoprotein with Yx(FWY)xxD motif
MRNRWWAAPAAAAGLALLAACGSSGTSGSGAATSPSTGGSSAAASSGSSAGTTAGNTSARGIKVTKTSKGTVLTSASGMTLYWFAIDTSTQSKCNGSCAAFWPPLIGKPSLASGSSANGTFGTIKRANGQLQATYDGHPLYMYKGDTAAGQVHGNDVNASGGLWWAMTPVGAKLTAAVSKPSTSSSSGGSGGYGY